MRTLHQIVIKETKSNKYQTTIELIELCNGTYNEIITTTYEGIKNYFEQQSDTYKEALKNFLEDVTEYANHTALMNL